MSKNLPLTSPSARRQALHKPPRLHSRPAMQAQRPSDVRVIVLTPTDMKVVYK